MSFKDFVKSCPKPLLRWIWLISEFRDQDLLSKCLLILFKRKDCQRFLRYTTLCCVENSWFSHFPWILLEFRVGFQSSQVETFPHGRLPKSGYKGTVLKTVRSVKRRVGSNPTSSFELISVNSRKITSEDFRMVSRVREHFVYWGIHFQRWLLHSLSRFWLVPS